MFGIGMQELILILVVALIVLGPKKLPEMAKSLGKALNEFKRATSDIKESLEADSSIKEVKKSFNSLNEDIKSTASSSYTQPEPSPEVKPQPPQSSSPGTAVPREDAADKDSEKRSTPSA